MRTFAKCVLAGVIILAARPALAADAVTGGIEIGVNIDNPNITGSDSSGVIINTKAGLAIGGFVEVPVNAVFSVQPELLYMMHRFDVGDTGNGRSPDSEHVDSIEIPVLARINFPSQSKAHAYLVAGPGFSFLTRFKETSPSGTENDLKDHVERADVSLIAGLGVAIGHFGIEGRYDGGLRNINKSLNGTDAAAKDRLSVKQRTFTILASWRFR
jgi:hypothetical protein